MQHQRLSRDTPLTATSDPNLRTSQIGVGATWELDFWGKYRRGIESDRAAMLASLAAYDNALVSLTAGVASDYLNIRTLQQRIQVAQDNVQTQKESLRIARAQFENGETSELDVQQALTQLAQTQAQIPGLENSLRATKDSLAVLLGLTPDRIDEQLGAGTTIPTAPGQVATGMPKDLLRRRPDVRQAELTAAAQSAGIGVAKSNLYPSFSLSGSFGYLSTSVGNNSLFSWDNRATAAGASFVLPIFNYGRIVNSIRVQDAVFEQAVLNYQNTVLEAQQEVEDARAAFRPRRRPSQHSATRPTRRAAPRNWPSCATRKAPRITPRCSRPSSCSCRSRMQLASAQGGVPLALVSVYRALGGGWQLRQARTCCPHRPARK